MASPDSSLQARLRRLLSELQRRKVIRVAAAYVVAGWIILQVAASLENTLTLPGWFDTVVFSFLVIGFPVALIASWLFEFTPEGIKRTVGSGDGALIRPHTSDWILTGMLVVVLGFAITQTFMPRPSETAPAVTGEATKPAAKIETPVLGDKSIAVLPFANLSPDKKNEYFADGLTEELLNLLAKVGDLKVISRTSSFAFKGKTTPLPEIAKQLGVRHILEGTVREEGGDLRLTAQLIDEAAGSGGHTSSDLNLTLGDLRRLSGDAAGAKVNYILARDDLLAAVKKQPQNTNPLEGLAWAYCGLGDRAAAMKYADRAVDLVPVAKDAISGASREDTRARIWARFGDRDRAIPAIARLLKLPGWLPLTPALLRLDADFDKLRGDPRFEALLVEDGKP